MLINIKCYETSIILKLLNPMETWDETTTHKTRLI